MIFELLGQKPCRIIYKFRQKLISGPETCEIGPKVGNRTCPDLSSSCPGTGIPGSYISCIHFPCRPPARRPTSAGSPPGETVDLQTADSQASAFQIPNRSPKILDPQSVDPQGVDSQVSVCQDLKNRWPDIVDSQSADSQSQSHPNLVLISISVESNPNLNLIPI